MLPQVHYWGAQEVQAQQGMQQGGKDLFTVTIGRTMITHPYSCMPPVLLPCDCFHLPI